MNCVTLSRGVVLTGETDSFLYDIYGILPAYNARIRWKSVRSSQTINRVNERQQYGVVGRLRLKCDGTGAETRFRLSAKRTSPFKSAWGRQFSRLLAAEVCGSAVVMLDTPCSEVVWRVLATYSIRQFPLHLPSRASPCAITFQLDSALTRLQVGQPRYCGSIPKYFKELCSPYLIFSGYRGLLPQG